MEEWNGGMMEYWVFLRILSIFNFMVMTTVDINPTIHYPKRVTSSFQYSIIPTFQSGRSP
jgi:hypothetical protein